MIKRLKAYMNNKNQAYPGDVHIKQQKSNEIQSTTLRKVAIACIILCALVDFINISDLMNLTYDIPSEVIKNPFLNLAAYFKPMFFTILITLGMAFSAIFFGALYRRMHNSYHELAYRIMFIALICTIFVAAIIINIFRITAEYKSAGGDTSLLSYDPIVLSSVYAAIMFIGIFVSLLYGMFGRDLLQENFTHYEKANIENDKNLYLHSIEKYKRDKFEESKYYETKRDLGLKISKVFRDVEIITSKLKCISDPAEIKEVDKAFANFVR